MNSKRIPNHRNSPDGFVLIVVMVICLGLVSLTLVFGHAMLMAYRGSETDVAGRQADRAIEGAVQYAEYLMTNSGTINSGTGTSAATYMLPDPTTYQSEAVPVGEAAFWFIGEPVSTDGTDTPAFGLVDEASKLNLNTASVAMLENLPNMTQDLAEAIIAWRKTVSSTTTSAATSAVSSSGGTNKGGPFESIFELSQVVNQDGDDPSILYGDDANLNHVQDFNEAPGGQFNPGIFEYVTVFSREPNTMSDGTKRVNVTQGGAALVTRLNALFGETREREIVPRIGSAPVRSVLEYYVRSGMSVAEFDRITPYLTMSNGAFATGLINVNTASQTVLGCVPGISAQQAAQLVSTRANQTQPYTNLAWLVPILGNPSAIQAGPYLTTQTYQVTADVAAVGRNGRGYRRALFVIDGSTGVPQVVYRHNMAALGWALGPTAMQTLGQNGQQSGQQRTMP
jgi:DNA uptake protein ComE-like DNA-binding protein